MPTSANRPQNGGISFCVPKEARGWRLDKALGLLLASPSPEQQAARPDLFALADRGLRARRRLCDRSLVLVNGKPGIPGLKLRAGQEITILPDPEGAVLPEDAPSLVYKDDGIAALYKPAGMHTAALAGSLSPSLETLLGDLLPSEGEGYAPRLLNRLDAPTSGLVLASRTEEGERRWYRAERIGNTDKLYLALIEGQPLYDFTVGRRLDTDTRNKTRVRHTDDPDPVRHTDVTLLAPLTAGDVPGLVESDDPDAPQGRAPPDPGASCRRRASAGRRFPLRRGIVLPFRFSFASRAGLASRFPSLPPSRVVSAASSEGAGESRGVFRNGRRMTIGEGGEFLGRVINYI